MIKITFELPDEVKDVVARMGTDIDSFIRAQVINPLMDHLKAQKEKDLVEEAQDQIISEVGEVKLKVKIDRKNYKKFKEMKDGKEIEIEKEVDDKGDPIEEKPKKNNK